MQKKVRGTENNALFKVVPDSSHICQHKREVKKMVAEMYESRSTIVVVL